MADLKLESKELERIAIFNRGKDILVHRLYKLIYSKDKYTVWYINDFQKAGIKESYQKIRNALKILEDKGYIVKVTGCYPVFWKRV